MVEGEVVKVSKGPGDVEYYQVCMRVHDEWVLQEIGTLARYKILLANRVKEEYRRAKIKFTGRGD